MNIFVLTTTYPSFTSDCQRLRAPDFVLRLSHEVSGSHKVTVIAPSSVNRLRIVSSCGIREVSFPFFLPGISSLIGEGGILERLRGNKAKIIQVPFLVLAHISFGIAEILKSNNSAIIHSHWLAYCGVIGFLIKRLIFWKKVRLIITIHGSDSFFFHYPVLRSLLRYSLRSSDAVTCVSSELVGAVRELSGVRARLMPMGVPDRLFEQGIQKRRTSGQLLFVGRVVISKGIDHIIAALEHLPESFNLVVVGDGPYLSTLKSSVHCGPYASRVTFCGWLDEAGVKAQMAISSCLVLPSESEGFSVTVLEGMAARLPVVGNDIPSLRAQLQDGRGYLVDVADSVALAHSISEAVTLDEAVIGRAERFAGQYRWSSVAKGYEALYREVASLTN